MIINDYRRFGLLLVDVNVTQKYHKVNFLILDELESQALRKDTSLHFIER